MQNEASPDKEKVATIELDRIDWFEGVVISIFYSLGAIVIQFIE